MSPILKAIAGALDTAAPSPGFRVAQLAELKGEETGEDASVFVERKRNPEGTWTCRMVTTMIKG